MKPRYYYPLRNENRQSTVECDLCIYGATPAGITAAVQAARLGKRVALVEFGRHLGGMTTSGLSATDVGNKHVINGLARRFYREVGERYGKKESWLFEPHVASDVYREWIDKYRIPLHTEKRLTSVEKEQGCITAMKTENGTEFVAGVYIDATYEGDLMAAAGVSYTVGRESDAEYAELFNGIQYGIHHNFLRFVDPYRKPGHPGSGLIYGVSDMPLGRQGGGDRLVQAYNFRLCLTGDDRNKVPFAKPDDYDPSKYELLRRYIDARVFDIFNLNRAIPNGKTDFNNWGAVNSDHIGANYGWPEGSYEEREIIYQDHVSYLQGMLYSLAHDPRLPENVRAASGAWGLAGDEFRETGNWPPQLYVREARRMVSDHVLTEHDSFGRTAPEDSIGMASYRMDSHNCKRVVYAGRAVNEGNIEVVPLDPIPIPYRSIRPKRSECRNLLVPVCLSASHIAYGMVRMEPVFMVLGQSAAIAACLAMDKTGCAVQDVSYSDLEQFMAREGITVTEPELEKRRKNPGRGEPPRNFQTGNETG